MKKQETNILVIEDHDASRQLLGVMLSKHFSQVITKKDGLEGLAWLSGGNFPDLIVLDVQMPRLDGLDFLKGIKKSGLFSNIPVIVLSANEDDVTRSVFLNLGVKAFISKPFNPLSIIRTIQTALKDEALSVNI